VIFSFTSFIIFILKKFSLQKSTQIISKRKSKANKQTPRVLSPFSGGGIVYLNDPDSYAGWGFYTPVRATQARQVEG